MSLTDENQSDLLGLLSGLGTPESGARARRLAETNTEAAQYLREVELIARACELIDDTNTEEQLPPEEVDRITKVVHQRWRRRKLRRIGVPVGAAAALLLLALGLMWIAIKPSGHPGYSPVATVVFMPLSQASPPGEDERRTKIIAGTELVTGNELARITFSDETVVVLFSYASSQIGQDGKSLALKKGHAFVRTAGTMRCQVDSIETRLEAGQAIISLGDEWLWWYVYKGSASIIVDGKSHEVYARQRASLDLSNDALQIDPFDAVLPDWVTRALPAPSDR